MKRPTIKQIIKETILHSKRKYITYWWLELASREFGIDKYGITHSATSYGRWSFDVIQELKLEKVNQDKRGKKFKWATWRVNG